MSTSDINNELKKIKEMNQQNSDMPEAAAEKPKIKNINDIIRNNIENLEKFVNNKVINIYSRPWNKLEPRLKKKKLEEYLQLLLDSKTISLTEFNKIIYGASKDINQFNSKQSELNKKLKVVYDKDDCVLTNYDYKNYL